MVQGDQAPPPGDDLPRLRGAQVTVTSEILGVGRTARVFKCSTTRPDGTLKAVVLKFVYAAKATEEEVLQANIQHQPNTCNCEVEALLRHM